MKLQTKAIEKEQKENTKKIQNLQKKLGMTIPQSPYPKIVAKNANAHQKKLKAKPEMKKKFIHLLLAIVAKCAR